MSNKITLISSDQESFEVEESIISQSQTIKNMIDDDCHTDGIPLLNVTGKTLSKVIEYCKKHAVKEDQEEEEPASAADKMNVKDELKKWDADFVKIDQAEGDEKAFVDVFDLILAANYLNIKDLLDLGCQTVADAITDKTPEQIRKIFNVENDFSPEEEAKVREENQWAFE